MVVIGRPVGRKGVRVNLESPGDRDAFVRGLAEPGVLEAVTAIGRLADLPPDARRLVTLFGSEG